MAEPENTEARLLEEIRQLRERVTDLECKAAVSRQTPPERPLFDSNLIGIATANVRRILDANDEFLRIAGRTREDLLKGEPCPCLDDRARAALQETGTCAPFEAEYRRTDGTTVPVLTGAALLQRDPLTWICFQLDLTGRKRFEEALRRSEAKFRSLFDSNVIGIGFGDVSGRITEVNDVCLRMSGYTREDVESGLLRWDHLSAPEYRAQDERAMEEFLQKGYYTPYEKEYIRKDGGRVQVLNGGALVDGMPDQAVAFFLDVSERKRIEGDLRKSETLLRRLWDSNIIGIVTANLERILDANDAYLGMVGYTREDLLEGKVRWRSMTPSEYWRKDEQALQELREKGACTAYEKAHYRKDGRPVPILIGAALLEQDPLQWVCFILDLTARKEMETRLAQSNEQLARASRLKSDFLSRISHELRTPMNAIVGFSDLLAEQKSGSLNETQKRFVGHVQDGALHILKLINDLLDLSKIEAGRVDMQCEHFHIAEALDEVVSVVEPLGEAKGITVASAVDPQLLVWADRLQLKQVLYNLLSNAVKFTPESGRVWIEASQQAELIRVSVSDTGMGIPLEEHEAIFQEFHQVRAKSQAAKEGTGLGLAITRRIIENHGGTLWVESEPGKGSRFSFTLFGTAPEERAQITA